MEQIKSVTQLTVTGYLDLLASREHAPGGGAVVALTAAQAAGLLSMVYLISADKSDAPAHPELHKHLEDVRHRLSMLAVADGVAFGKVLAAYKLPKTTDAEREQRDESVQEALQGAAHVPLQVMQAVDELFDDAEEVIERAKPSVLSDAAIAVRLLYTALKASIYNIEINHRYITDKHFKRDMEDTVREVLDDKKSLRRRLLKQIKNKLDA